MVFWEIVRLLLGEKEEETKAKKLGLTELEATKYDIDREIKRIKELLPKAQKIIEQKIKEEPDNGVLKEMYEYLSGAIREGDFPSAVLLIHLAAAAEKDLHKNPEKLIKYLIVAADKSARAIVRRIDYPYREYDLSKQRSIPYVRLTDYLAYMGRILRLLKFLKYDHPDPVWEKYQNLILKLNEKIYDVQKAYGNYYAHNYAWYEQEIIDPLGKQLFPDIWGKDPEELLGVKGELSSTGGGEGFSELLREICDIKDRLARIESLLERLLESCSGE